MSADGDIFDLYFDMVAPCSEAPFIYHRWALITTVAAILSRNVSLKFGFDTIYPNFYCTLIGSAGSRKSSAISIARKVAEQAGFTKFAREKSSKEKFLTDLSVGFDFINSHSETDDVVESALDKKISGETSDVLICAGELEDFLGSNDTAFISLLTNLWDNLPKYEHGKQTGKDVYVEKPTVSMIGGATPITFRTVFPPEVIGQGMLSRMPLIYGGGARCKLTLPPPPNAELFTFISSHLAVVAKLKGEMVVSDEAMAIWDKVYKETFPIDDARLESYSGRRHIHYYKLCMILAACDCSLTITKHHAILANTILHYAEQQMPKALGEFGASQNSLQTSTVLNYIRTARGGNGVRLSEIFKATSNEFRNMKECAEVCLKLRDSGKIRAAQDKMIPVLGDRKNSYSFVDFSLLREYDQQQPSSE